MGSLYYVLLMLFPRSFLILNILYIESDHDIHSFYSGISPKDPKRSGPGASDESSSGSRSNDGKRQYRNGQLGLTTSHFSNGLFHPFNFRRYVKRHGLREIHVLLKLLVSTSRILFLPGAAIQKHASLVDSSKSLSTALIEEWLDEILSSSWIK